MTRRTLDLAYVVPASDTARYLPSCLESLRNQAGVSAQVIVVDDGADDDGSIAAAVGPYRDGFARFDLLRTAGAAGPGVARNLGIERVDATWTMFVDSDDFIRPNVVARIAAFASAARSDLVVFDFARLFPDGRTVRNHRRATFALGNRSSVDVRTHPELLDNYPVVWNKLYRTATIQDHHAFPNGIYEDMPFTYRLLYDTRSIAVLDEVVYYYRQRPSADSALSTLDRTHLDFLRQWDRIDEFSAVLPTDDRDRLFERLLEHALFVFERRVTQLSSSDQRVFFDALHRRARRHPDRTRHVVGPVPAGALLRGGPRGLATLRRWGPGAERIRQSTRRLRRGPAKVGRVQRSAVDAAAFRRAVRRSEVRDDIVVFSSSWNRRPSCNPLALSAALSQSHPELRQHWIVRPGEAVPDWFAEHSVEVHRPGTPEARLIASARLLVNNVNFPDHVEKRPGQIFLQTQHGTPLKTMGVEQAQFPMTATPGAVAGIARRSSAWDYVVSSNPHSSTTWRSAFPFDYEMLEVGYPRNDIFFTLGDDDRAATRTRLGVPAATRFVLYVPTFRDYLSDQTDRFDWPMLNRVLEELDIVVGFRGHYLRAAGDTNRGDRVIDVSGEPDVQRLCWASDALITDFSSIAFDYALLDRPSLLYLDDFAEYRAARGLYLDPHEHGPGPISHTQEAVHEQLRLVAERDWKPASELRAFRSEFCPWDDGHATESVIERVMSSFGR